VETWAAGDLVKSVQECLEAYQTSKETLTSRLPTGDNYGYEYRRRPLKTDAPTGLAPPSLGDAAAAATQASNIHDYETHTYFVCEADGVTPLKLDLPFTYGCLVLAGFKGSVQSVT
jgi:hypothetical protein